MPKMADTRRPKRTTRLFGEIDEGRPEVKDG